jgi:hypothetical protein
MRRVMWSLAVLGLAASLFAADPFAGTWKLNVARSTIKSGPPPKSEISTFTAQDNGLKLAVNGVGADGKAFHVEYAATFDGKDYPLKGFTDADMIVINRVDAYTFYEQFKKAGKQVYSARLVVSKDGKTLTRTLNTKNAKGQDVTDTAVYKRQ